jgi:hypothetical protein
VADGAGLGLAVRQVGGLDDRVVGQLPPGLAAGVVVNEVGLTAQGVGDGLNQALGRP